MITQNRSEQVLWMADCYSLAKHINDPRQWMSLLEPTDASGSPRQPLHYWLWMEIWKAAQSGSDMPKCGHA